MSAGKVANVLEAEVGPWLGAAHVTLRTDRGDVRLVLQLSDARALALALERVADAGSLSGEDAAEPRPSGSLSPDQDDLGHAGQV